MLRREVVLLADILDRSNRPPPRADSTHFQWPTRAALSARRCQNISVREDGALAGENARHVEAVQDHPLAGSFAPQAELTSARSPRVVRNSSASRYQQDTRGG